MTHNAKNVQKVRSATVAITLSLKRGIGVLILTVPYLKNARTIRHVSDLQKKWMNLNTLESERKDTEAIYAIPELVIISELVRCTVRNVFRSMRLSLYTFS